METVYIEQFSTSYQMTNCNTATIFMIKRLYLLFITNNFISNDANVTTYKYFTRKTQ